MNIGIDLDGVVFDSEDMFRTWACFYNDKINGGDMVNPEELKAVSRYSWTKEQEMNFLNECLIPIEQEAPLKYKAREVLKYLKDRGHKLYVITSRGAMDTKEVEVTLDRLREVGVDFDDIVHSVSDKERVCRELNIDLMIDDYYNYVLNIANSGVKCLYFRGQVLKQISHPNVVEVRNWGDVYTQIRKIEKNII